MVTRMTIALHIQEDKLSKKGLPTHEERALDGGGRKEDYTDHGSEVINLQL